MRSDKRKVSVPSFCHTLPAELYCIISIWVLLNMWPLIDLTSVAHCRSLIACCHCSPHGLGLMPGCQSDCCRAQSSLLSFYITAGQDCSADNECVTTATCDTGNTGKCLANGEISCMPNLLVARPTSRAKFIRNWPSLLWAMSSGLPHKCQKHNATVSDC